MSCEEAKRTLLEQLKNDLAQEQMQLIKENEAKIFIQNAMEQSRNALVELMLIMPKVFMDRKSNLGEYYSNLENCKKEIQACEVAVKALEEVQRWHTSVINPKIKNVFANSSTQICQNCDHKDEYIEELEAEVEQYRAIGTPEECREWKEKQSAKKVISFDYNNGTVNYGCPVCKRKIISKIDGKWCGGTFNEYCDRCGQKLDWSGEE